MRWPRSVGGDGALRSLVIVETPWAWFDARDFAQSIGASLARCGSSGELALLELMSDHAGAFDCGGPWIGGFREPDAPWLWTDKSDVGSFGWAPARPAQSLVFASALMMSGTGGPDGRWIDAFPDPDAGVSTRAALLVWGDFTDCDRDDRPDALEIAADPTLDADQDGRLDDCTPAQAGDVNGDGRVDALDLAAVLNAWGSSDPAADLDGSGIVDAADLSTVLNGWTGS